jgi:phage/plasmid primase-like uncharacterized protein
MACEHRYRVELDDSGKGRIQCQRCGDIHMDGLATHSDMDQIRERLEWEKRRANSPIILPRVI